MVYDAIYPYVIGGVELRNWELAKRLGQRGHEVSLLGMRFWQGAPVSKRQAVTLHGVCPAKPLYSSKGRRAIWPPVYFALNVLRPLCEGDFDVIDVASFPYFPLLSAKLASSRNRARLVVTWIEVWDRYWSTYLGAKGALAMALERFCAYLTDNPVAISQTTKKDLRRLGLREPVSVIPCGVDNTRIREIEPSGETSDVIFAGRLIKEKNVDLLLGAICRLVRSKPSFKGIIIGDGPERSSLASAIKRKNLQDNVRMMPFLERQSDLFARMKASRVFVLPSSREGFGIVALEANACGLPVVTTRHPQNAAVELVRDGENGLLCEPSEADLSEKISRLLCGSSITRAQCMAVAASYDWDEIALSLERFYQSKAGARR